MKAPKEFIPNKNNTYHYGLFYEEKDTGYYLSDETLNKISLLVNWKLTFLEAKYMTFWKEFEIIHRKFSLGKLSIDCYDKLLKRKYIDYFKITDYEFGENCDELINFLIRNLR